MNWVPTNLCVPVPDGVAAEHAAFATVGAVAMQGVRRAEVALGETACVIGLGLIGQLVVRLLVASGVQVVGLDGCGLAVEPPRRPVRLPVPLPTRRASVRSSTSSSLAPAAWARITSCWPPAVIRTARSR